MTETQTGSNELRDGRLPASRGDAGGLCRKWSAEGWWKDNTVGLELTSRPVWEGPGGSADEAGLDGESGSEGP